MKFTLRLPPQHLDLLNLRMQIRAKGCPHCHCQSYLKSHGYLYGQASSGHDEVTRGLRFFVPDATRIKVVAEPSRFTGTTYFPTAHYGPSNFSICCLP